jgi:hypothetical protein
VTTSMVLLVTVDVMGVSSPHKVPTKKGDGSKDAWAGGAGTDCGTMASFKATCIPLTPNH